MKYKHVYAAHEIRMWIVTGITLVGTAGAILERHPEIKEKAKDKWDDFTGKFKKNNPKTKTIKIVVIKGGEG